MTIGDLHKLNERNALKKMKPILELINQTEAHPLTNSEIHTIQDFLKY